MNNTIKNKLELNGENPQHINIKLVQCFDKLLRDRM